MYSESPPEAIRNDQDRHSAFLYAQQRAYACMIMSEQTDQDHYDLKIDFQTKAHTWAMIAQALRRTT